MATTYGERLLAEIEERARRRRQLRRLALVFGPAAVATGLATLRTVSLRSADLAADGLGRTVLDAAAVVGYALVFVIVPLYAAVGEGLHARAAAIALVAGPLAMPLLFGPGWRWWQQALAAAACMLVIAARYSRTRPQDRRRRDRRR